MKTKHAILFRLSNKIVQVCFLDQTEIILSSETKIVSYTDKKGIRTKYPLNTALDSDNYEIIIIKLKKKFDFVAQKCYFFQKYEQNHFLGSFELFSGELVAIGNIKKIYE